MNLYFLLSLLIVPAALIGLVRFTNMDKAYRPFLYYVFLSVLNEVVSHFLVRLPKQYQLADLNLFVLLEFLLLLYQFYKWDVFRRYPKVYYLVMGGYLLIWIFENGIRSDITTYNPWFILLRSFMIVLLSINVINRVAIDVSEPIYKQARFVISIGLIVFFTCNMIVSALFLVSNKIVGLNFFKIQVYANSLANVIYAVGVYLIPGKSREITFPQRP